MDNDGLPDADNLDGGLVLVLFTIEIVDGSNFAVELSLGGVGGVFEGEVIPAAAVDGAGLGVDLGESFFSLGGGFVDNLISPQTTSEPTAKIW